MNEILYVIVGGLIGGGVQYFTMRQQWNEERRKRARDRRYDREQRRIEELKRSLIAAIRLSTPSQRRPVDPDQLILQVLECQVLLNMDDPLHRRINSRLNHLAHAADTGIPLTNLHEVHGELVDYVRQLVDPRAAISS